MQSNLYNICMVFVYLYGICLLLYCCDYFYNIFRQNVQGQMSSVENTRLISERDAARAQMVEYTRKNEELLKQ